MCKQTCTLWHNKGSYKCLATNHCLNIHTQLLTILAVIYIYTYKTSTCPFITEDTMMHVHKRSQL